MDRMRRRGGKDNIIVLPGKVQCITHDVSDDSTVFHSLIKSLDVAESVRKPYSIFAGSASATNIEL